MLRKTVRVLASASLQCWEQKSWKFLAVIVGLIGRSKPRAKRNAQVQYPRQKVGTGVGLEIVEDFVMATLVVMQVEGLSSAKCLVVRMTNRTAN